jgi:sortase (surface protein transpeptidase)
METIMAILVETAAGFVRAGTQIRTHKRKVAFLAIVVFTGTVYGLARLDLLPNPPSAVSAEAAPVVTVSAEAASSTPAAKLEAPVKIVISKIGLSATISNPETTDIDALDKLLLSGAVRYPTSALLGGQGNVVLFGHSSYLPIVGNPAYKTFDGIQKLVAGDTITVYSDDRAYTYVVRTMQKESANDAAIPLTVAGKVLTLSTCNSFGAKTDRFVVTADFVESHPLGA